jgi:hypothetical protein
MWLWLTTYHKTRNTRGFGSPPITTNATHVALAHHLSQHMQHMQLWFTTCYKTRNTSTHVALAHHLSQHTQHMWLWLTTYHKTRNTCGFGSPPITTNATYVACKFVQEEAEKLKVISYVTRA